MPPSPGVWPREESRPAKSHGERAVWRALRAGLPPGWYAWHSLRIRDRHGYLGEGDFVLAHPRRGLLALEVKAGRIEQRPSNIGILEGGLDPEMNAHQRETILKIAKKRFGDPVR